MSSIHISKAREKAQSKGAAAGSVSYGLWELPKREIIEVALHLAALSTDSYDRTMQSGDKGEQRFWDERQTLKQNGLL